MQERTPSSSALRDPATSSKVLTGNMPSPWTLVLFYQAILSSAIGFKLPSMDQSIPKDHDAALLWKSNSSPFRYQWEESLDKDSPTLIRLVRDISETMKGDSGVEKVSKSPPEKSPDVKEAEMVTKSPPEKTDVTYSKGDESPLDVKYPSKGETVSKTPPSMPSKAPEKVEPVSKSLLELSPEVTPKIINPSKVKTMALLEDETTSVTDSITPVPGKSNEKTTTEVMKTTGEDMKLSTTTNPPSTKSEDIPLVTNTKADIVTTSNQLDLSTIPASSSNTLVESVPSQKPSDPPSKSSVTSANPTPVNEKTTQWISVLPGSTTTAMVTATSSEDKMHVHSLMKQCMLAILILAVLCTIFIITTIALAAKLATMKQRQKLRHPATYQEMRCISTLLPENDQQSKLKPNRLKTFAATLEESDGDTTTLNSFLPDH